MPKPCRVCQAPGWVDWTEEDGYIVCPRCAGTHYDTPISCCLPGDDEECGHGIE